jgi:hypothetical protein
VILDVDRREAPWNHLSILRDHITRTNLIADPGKSSVDGHPTGVDEPIGFSPRTDPVLGEELVNADGVSHEVLGTGQF